MRDFFLNAEFIIRLHESYGIALESQVAGSGLRTIMLDELSRLMASLDLSLGEYSRSFRCSSRVNALQLSGHPIR